MDPGEGQGAGGARTGRGVGFWLLVAAGVVMAICGGAVILAWDTIHDVFTIATAPPDERDALLSSKLASLAGERQTVVDGFLAAVDDSRDADAWAMTSPGFQSVTTRKQFDDLAALVRDVMGKCLSKSIRNFN